jgi:hypothetical protein
LKYYILIKKVSDRIGQLCLSAISFSVLIRQNLKILKDWPYYSTKPFRAVEPFFSACFRDFDQGADLPALASP